MLICDAQKRILFASALYHGRVHDFAIFKEILGKFDFSGLTLHVDLGFLGIKKGLAGGQIFIPYKASKNRPLTPEEKAKNSAFARLRVVVENALAKIKSFFVLRIENRMKLKRKLDEAFEICAGLANFKTSLLKPADS